MDGGASPRKAAAKCPPAADDPAAAAAAGDTPRDPWTPVSGAPTMRLPDEYVERYLCRKPTTLDEEEDPDEYYDRMINDPEMVEIFTKEYIEDERQMMRDMAAGNQMMRDMFERFQGFARPQLMEKGYVEVDAAHMAERVRNWEIHLGGRWGDGITDDDGIDLLDDPGADADE